MTIKKLRILSIVCITLIGIAGCAASGTLVDFLNNDTPQPPPAVENQIGAPLQASRAASFLSAGFANRHNDFNNASRFISEVVGQTDDEDIDLLQQEIALDIIKGDFHNAFKQNGILLEKDPTSNIGNSLYAIELAKAGQYSQALATWHKIPDDYSGKFIKPLSEAWAWAGVGNTSAAIQALNALEKFINLEGLMQFHQALLYDLAGDQKKALAHFENASKIANPYTVRYLTIINSFYLRAGYPEKAQALINGMLERQPDTVFQHLLENMLTQDVATLSPLSAQQGLYEALYDIATIFAAQNRPRQALFYAQLARYIEPESPIINLFIANLYVMLDRPQMANTILNQPLFKGPFLWISRLRQANNLFQSGQHKAALAMLNKLQKEHRSQIDALTLQADIYRDQKKFAKAIKLYTKVIALSAPIEKRHWPLFYTRGIAYEQNNQWAKAQADLKKALSLNPNQPFVLNYLGYSWIDRGLNIEEAKKYVMKAVSLEPSNAFIIDSLGWALYKLKDYKGALKYLEKAVAIRPQDPVIVDHLADGYWQLGRENEARFMWQQALSFKPEADLKQEIQAKLTTGLINNPGQ